MPKEKLFAELYAAETRTRYQMILLAHRCYTAPQIARVVLLSKDTMCVLKRFMAGGLADVFSAQVRATVACTTLRGCEVMIIADNHMVRNAQSSRLVCRLLTEISCEVYLIYTHAFNPDANGTLLALARRAVTHNHECRNFESLLADVKTHFDTLNQTPGEVLRQLGSPAGTRHSFSSVTNSCHTINLQQFRSQQYLASYHRFT